MITDSNQACLAKMSGCELQEVLLRGDPGKIGRNAVVWDEVIAIVLNCLDKSYWTSFLVSFCPPNPIKPSSEAVTGKIQNRLRFSGENEEVIRSRSLICNIASLTPSF
jgi:hypothetical protein